MKKYTSISGYLERFSLFQIGKLKVRLHHILSSDKTPYCHSHPFYYLSIILKGSYTEQIIKNGQIIEKTHKKGGIILRKASTFHRIKKANTCTTLFFAWDSKNKWQLKTHQDIIYPNYQAPAVSGIYERIINGQKVYCKFDNFWFIGSSHIEKAQSETRLSIYQVGQWANLDN